METFPLRIPLKPGGSDAAAWGDKDLPAADSRSEVSRMSAFDPGADIHGPEQLVAVQVPLPAFH